MPEPDKRSQLLYDGDCGICTRTAEILEKLDGGREFAIKPYRSLSEDDLKQYSLSDQKCSKRAYAITPSDKVYGGAFAVNYFFWKRFPWSLLVLLIYAFPPLLLAEMLGYYLVAKNRYRISRWLGLEACRVKP